MPAAVLVAFLLVSGTPFSLVAEKAVPPGPRQTTLESSRIPSTPWVDSAPDPVVPLALPAARSAFTPWPGSVRVAGRKADPEAWSAVPAPEAPPPRA